MSRTTSMSLGTGVAALGLAFVAAACSNSSEPSGDVARGAASGGALRIIADDAAFSPAILEARTGRKVTVEISNRDDMAHDFAAESLDLNTGTIEAGERATATFTMPDGAVKFTCTYHDGMAGRIEPR